MSVHSDDVTADASNATTKDAASGSNNTTRNIVGDAAAGAKNVTTKILDDAAAGTKNATTKIRELVEQYGLPGFDLDEFIAARQADIDALSKATATAFAGAQSITEKQAELLKATLDELKDAVTPASAEAGSAASLQETVKKQTDLVQDSLSRTLESMKEMAEAAQHAQADVFNIAVKRVQSNAEELRALFGAKKK